MCQGVYPPLAHLIIRMLGKATVENAGGAENGSGFGFQHVVTGSQLSALSFELSAIHRRAAARARGESAAFGLDSID